MSLLDRFNSISKKSPSSLLPDEPGRPSSKQRLEQLPQHSPSTLLPEVPKVDRDPDIAQAAAVSPSSLLPEPLFGHRPEQLPQQSPRSLLPEAPVVGREPLIEKPVAVSPASLLPPSPEVSFFKRRAEQLPEQGPGSLLPEVPADATRGATGEELVTVSPSSLLPDATPAAYRKLAKEELVSVSPSELLPPRPPSFLSRWINAWSLASVGVIALVAVLVAFSVYYQPTPQLMQEAVDSAHNDNHDSAVFWLTKVLQRQPDHAEARFLLGRSQIALGNPEVAEAELRRALVAGWPKREVQVELARALLRQGKYQALLDEVVADAGDSATHAGKINALRGLAFFAVGNESEARTAFEVSLSQLPESPNALLGLARLAERAKRFDEADKLIERAVRADARNAEGWLLKGELRWR